MIINANEIEMTQRREQREKEKQTKRKRAREVEDSIRNVYLILIYAHTCYIMYVHPSYTLLQCKTTGTKHTYMYTEPHINVILKDEHIYMCTQ